VSVDDERAGADQLIARRSWLTLTGAIDASATGFNETFTVSGVWEGSNSDDVHVKVHWRPRSATSERGRPLTGR